MVNHNDVLVLSGTRTAIGKYGGGLAAVPPCELAATVVRAAVSRTRASSGSVPLMSAISRSAVSGASRRAVLAAVRRALSAGVEFSSACSAVLCSSCRRRPLPTVAGRDERWSTGLLGGGRPALDG